MYSVIILFFSSLFFLKKRFRFILIPYIFMLISTFPLLTLTYFFQNEIWFEHLFLNTLTVFIAILLSFLIPYYLNPFIIISEFFKKIRFKDSYKIYLFIFFIIFFLEFIGIFYYGHASFLSFFNGDDLLAIRTKIITVPFPLNIYYSNDSIVQIIFIFYSFYFLNIEKKDRFVNFIILILSVLFYISQFKKSTFILLFFIFLIMYVYGKRFKLSTFFNLKFLCILILFSATFIFVLENYYPGKNIFLSVGSRLFFEGVGDSSTFYNLFNLTINNPLDYIPSVGAKLFGFDGISLEKKFFIEVYGNLDRYGMHSTLNYTYVYVLFGENALFFNILIFSLVSNMLCYYYRQKNKYGCFLSHAFFYISVLLQFTLFFTGIFKTTSIFTFFPLVNYIFFILFYSFYPSKNIKRDFVCT